MEYGDRRRGLEAVTNDREHLPGYLAAQSSKLSAHEIAARLREEAERFLAAVVGVDEQSAHRRPSGAEWSVAEIVDHVTRTLEDVTPIIRALMRGKRPGRPMTIEIPPTNATRPLTELLIRLRASQHAVDALLMSAVHESHTDLRVSDYDFGEINWKGYALVLRLHYKDHTEQVRRTVSAVAAGSSAP
jgi:hypothetical protein